MVVNYRRSEAAARGLSEQLGERSVAIQADVTVPEDVEAMVEEAIRFFGEPITTVVNNALADYQFNGDARKRIEDIGWDAIASQVETSVRGALTTIQATAPGMRGIGFGRVINIGTNLFQNPVIAYHDYTAAKAALLSMTRTAAADLGPYGVTVNMVSGGLLRTTGASAATPEEVFDMIARSTPLGRVTTPEEFADAVLFFASPWSRSVTGQNLIVDGGLVRS